MVLKRKGPDLILRDGKPSAVILDIDDYQELLERLDDLEDLRMLEKMRAKPQQFKRLADVLTDLGSGA
jgi:PHD/YefM family antitoxin component YafN of YafNO toxin-antitoxin module